MDTNRDDLSAFERRLAAWEPSAEGLDADAMLFAAGVAAGRPGRRARLVWPAMAGCLAVAVVLSIGWAVAERRERVALARLLQQPPERPAPAQRVLPPESPADAEPNTVLSAHRALEHGPDAWPPQPVGSHVGDSTPPVVLEAGQRNALLGP